MTTLYTHGINRPEQVVVLGDGNAEVRFNIQQDTETNPVIDPETGQPTGETETLVIFKAEHALTPYPLAYDKLVSAMIRQKYTSDDELAMARKCYTEVEDYKAYDAYVEECKRIAAGFLGLEYKPSFMPTQSEVMAQLRTLAKSAASQLPDEEAANVPSLFDAWEPDIDVVKDERRYFGGSLYKCAQPHHTQVGWEPDKTPALWVKVSTEEWPEWVQPTGAQDAYAKGDKTSHNGKHWTSDVDGNVWEPGVYGWIEAA